MSKYDYGQAVKDDIRSYIEENSIKPDFGESRDDFEGRLYEELWAEDSVTGNASGSYTFNTYQAEENLCHNLDLLGEALTEFGCSADYLSHNGAEAADVTIRCYLLGGAINAVVGEFWDSWQEEYEEELISE